MIDFAGIRQVEREKLGSRDLVGSMFYDMLRGVVGTNRDCRVRFVRRMVWCDLVE